MNSNPDFAISVAAADLSIYIQNLKPTDGGLVHVLMAVILVLMAASVRKCQIPNLSEIRSSIHWDNLCMRTKLFLIALIICLAASSPAMAKYEKELVLTYLNVITDVQGCGLIEYLFFSEGDDGEYLLDLRDCKSKGWMVKPESDKKCMDYIRQKYSKPGDSRSEYFWWLREKLEEPLKTFQIKSKKTFRRTPDDPEAYTEIVGRFNNKVDLTFKLPIFDPQGPYFGRIRLMKINGKLVEEMLRQELEAQKVSK